jgi:hypothetical protein
MNLLSFVLLFALQSSPLAGDVPGNLVLDPHATNGGSGWRGGNEATVENVNGNHCFVVRNRGGFQQTIAIPPVQAGARVVLLARASSERVNADGSVTGVPYLYGLMFGVDPKRVVGYLQGRGPDSRMRSQATQPNQWVTLSGIFEVPEGATRLELSLHLGERKGDPHNGSAGRFDDIAVVVLPTLEEARAFVARYR